MNENVKLIITTVYAYACFMCLTKGYTLARDPDGRKKSKLNLHLSNLLPQDKGRVLFVNLVLQVITFVADRLSC